MVVGARARPCPHSCCLAVHSRWWWVLGPFVSPRWVLVSAIGGDGAGHSPPFAPLVVCSPLFVWPGCVAPLLRVVVVVSVGGVLLDVYETKWLTIN